MHYTEEFTAIVCSNSHNHLNFREQTSEKKRKVCKERQTHTDSSQAGRKKNESEGEPWQLHILFRTNGHGIVVRLIAEELEKNAHSRILWKTRYPCPHKNI